MALDVREAPAEKPIAGSEKALLAWTAWFSQIRDIAGALTMSGPTEKRPTGFLWIGRPYWDETLQKPVYLASFGPNVWKDAMGGVV